MKYIHPVRHARPESLVGQVYTDIKHDFGVVGDPFTLHSPIPELLAGMWSVVRETEVVGQVHWSIKEAVAAAVSKINACPYCVEIHTALAAAPASQQLTDLIKQGRTAAIADPSLRSIVTWALTTGSPGADLLLAPPFSAQEAPELIGTAVVYHYINRMVNVFLPESLLPSLLQGAWIRDRVWNRVGRRLARGRDQAKPLGTSLRFLPEADLPAEMSWAKASPTIARAFAGWAALVERIGEQVLAPRVRAQVSDYLQAWNGEPAELGRAWVERAVSGLTEADQAAARLVLLTALASYQVDEKIIGAFRASHAADAQLVGAVAWASFAATRRIASWL